MKNNLKFLTISLTFLVSVNLYSKDFSTSSLKNIKTKKSVQLKNKKVFALFWATWCANCKDKLTKQLPVWRKKYPGVSFVSVNIDENPRRALQYLKKYEIRSRNVYRAPRLVKKLKIKNAPTWAIFEYEGDKLKLVKKKTGFQKRTIASLLK